MRRKDGKRKEWGSALKEAMKDPRYKENPNDEISRTISPVGK